MQVRRCEYKIVKIRIVRWSNIRHKIIFAIIAVFTVMGVPRARTQAIYGSIAGTVQDSSGAALPNAIITVTDQNKGTVKTAATGSEGVYNVQQLIPGSYRVKVQAPGFASAESDVMDVVADSASASMFSLKSGAMKQRSR